MEAYKYNGDVYYKLNDIILASSAFFLEDALDIILNENDYLRLDGDNLKGFYKKNWIRKGLQESELVIISQAGKDILMGIPKLGILTNNIKKLHRLISFANEQW